MADGNGPPSRASESSTFIDFLDPLFAVAIGVGFEGILLEPWLKEWRIPKGQDLFSLFVFILGILTITLSWFGYHKSIRKMSIEGRGRFIVDIELLILYILLVYQYKNLGAVLFILAAIYLSFVLWDLLKIAEHPEKYPSKDENGKEINLFTRYNRELITFQWSVIFLIFPIAHHFSGDTNYLLILAYLGTVFYRVDKDKHFLGSLFNWLKGRRS